MSPVLSRSVRRFAPWLSLVLVYLVLGFASRLVLWGKFGLDADVSAVNLPFLMLAGLVNDFVESLYLFAPLALYILLLPDRWFRARWNRVMLYAGTLVCIASLLYLAATEYFFFEEFDARFNLVAFDYLAFPGEVFIDIWEAYPVVKVLLAAILLGAIITYAVRPWLDASRMPAVRLRERLVLFVPYAVLLLLAIAYYPTDALSLSANRVENELLQNGHSSFFLAARTSDIDYESYYLTRPPCGEPCAAACPARGRRRAVHATRGRSSQPQSRGPAGRPRTIERHRGVERVVRRRVQQAARLG